jgi:hypothetical protein
MEQQGCVVCLRPLRPFVKLAMYNSIICFPLFDVLLGLWPLLVITAISTLVRVWLYSCVVESLLCYQLFQPFPCMMRVWYKVHGWRAKVLELMGIQNWLWIRGVVVPMLHSGSACRCASTWVGTPVTLEFRLAVWGVVVPMVCRPACRCVSTWVGTPVTLTTAMHNISVYLWSRGPTALVSEQDWL